jgi:hypothetical protein
MNTTDRQAVRDQIAATLYAIGVMGAACTILRILADVATSLLN